MKKLLMLLVASLTLTTCSIFQSQEKRAQTHLKKAVSLDPTIMKTTTKDSIRLLDSVRIVDSIRIKDSVDIITKDSTIITPPSDLNGVIETPCDSSIGLKPFDYKLGSGVHKLHIWSDGKKILYTSTVDQLVSTIRSKDTYIEHLESRDRVKDSIHSSEIERLKKDVVTIIKYQPTTWQTIKLTGLGLLIGLIVGFVLFKVLKIPVFGL